MFRHRYLISTILVLFVFLLNACGGGGSDDSTIDATELPRAAVEAEQFFKAPSTGPIYAIEVVKTLTPSVVQVVTESLAMGTANQPGPGKGVVTGKPLELGGSAGREQATGRGASLMIKEVARDVGIPMEQSTIAIQGFGNVGSWAARFLDQGGCRVIAVGDVNGGVRNGQGLDLDQLNTHVDNAGTVFGFKGGEAITNEELLELECDFLVPAALGGAIHSENATRVRARMVVEGANNPVTPGGEAVLNDSGILCLPDLLANAGGVTVSYFEWVQNIQRFPWDLSRVNEALEEILVKAYREVRNIVEEEKISYRDAAFSIAVGRVVQALELQGLP